MRRVLGQHILVFSQATFDELHTRIYRPKFDRYITLEQRQRLLHDFNACAHWVDLAPYTALQAQADWLVSGDRDLLEAKPLAGLRIVTPMQALEKVVTLAAP